MMDLIETTPKMDLAIQDMAPRVEALRASHALYSPLLQRRAQREAAPSSLQGWLAMSSGKRTRRPRQTSEPSCHGSISDTSIPGIAIRNGVVRYVQRA